MIQQHHHTIAHILQLIGGGAIGLFTASIANHYGFRSADRFPGESRMPHCVHCLTPLSWQGAFPFFGWLMRLDPMKFPCPCGRQGGLWQQPAVEIAGFLLGMAAMFLVGWSWMAVPLVIGLALLPAIAMIDLYFGIIPDELNILLGLMGLLWVMLSGGNIYIALIVLSVLLTLGLFCALVYSRWRGRDMLGLGDVKFFAAAGLWLQPEVVPWFLAIAGFTGAIVGVLWQRLGGGKESPFGPALCLSMIGCIIYQLIKL